MGVLDEFDYGPGDRYLDEETEMRDAQDTDKALLGDYSGRLHSETRADQKLRETTANGRAISSRIRALTKDGWCAEQINLVLSQVAQQERDRARSASRNEREQKMAYGDEYARDKADANGMGHGGWRPNKFGGLIASEPGRGKARAAQSIVIMGHLLDALAKAGLGDFPLAPEPTRFPTEPPVGSVLKWVKTFRRNPEYGYTYVALHIAGGWYLTGRNVDPVTFNELTEMIGDSPCELATNWVQIPQLEQRPLDGLTPEEWFLAMYPQDVVDNDEGLEG